MTPALILPPCEPDAVAREGENLRRARTVFASRKSIGRAVVGFHAATLRQGSASVVPKLKTQFGEMAA